MANRIVGNVYIIDSAMGNLPLMGAGSSSWLASEVVSFLFWGADSTSTVKFTEDNTSNAVLVLSNPNNSPCSVGAVVNGVSFDEMKVPTLVNGTAWIYFK